VPAVAAYRGSLWVLWADMEDNIWYAVTTREGEFGRRLRFPERGLPVIANLNGHLHAVITLETGEMVHYLYDDEEKRAWAFLCPVADAITYSSPCLVAFRNELFLVLIRDGHIYYLTWTSSTSHPNSASESQGYWSEPASLCEDGQTFEGIAALFVLDGVLHALCRSGDDSRGILGYKYEYMSSTWSSSEDVSGGRAVNGVSATSFGNRLYLGFTEQGPGGANHGVYVAAYADGKWQPQEGVAGQTAADTPQLAILNGRIHAIFTDNTEARYLQWYSRPVLSYSPSSWMKDIPDDALISHLTIPGTHDSVARGRIPFVRTQHLSITQQLPLGIRFLDLRLRVHDDGDLYCYHGGIPAHFPDGPVSFESVMDEVWTFLRGADGSRPPTETVLISINNDNSSPEELMDPAPFYRAVESAIAATPSYPDGTHRWFVEPVTPTLGRARGRAVLLRRYGGDPSINHTARQGLDVSEWLDNSPEFTIVTPTNIKLHLQDKWRYTQRISLEQLVTSKSGHVQQLMERAATSAVGDADADTNLDADEDADADGWCVITRADYKERDDWFINFCSAVGDPAKQGEIAQAKWIAVGARSGWFGPWVDGMNVRTRNYIQRLEKHETAMFKRRLGIVNLDYPELPVDNDLVARLIEMNF
jgi:1-phosphatidylinositol phosphodiesterase